MNLQKNLLIGRCIASTMICVFFALSSYADPISHQQASARALKFLNDKSASMSGDVQQSPVIGNVAELSTAYESDAYYVFNVGNDSGFVIVGGDDIAKPILGYADKGSFDANRIPDNMKAWLDTYAQQIKEAQRSGKTSFKSNAGKTRRNIVRKRVPILMTTLWGQDAPYNDFEVNKYPTGCVATALAQIMKYHNWPESTTKTIPAYSKYPELQPTSFDWNNMRDSYRNTADSTSRAAVSTLMKYIGYAVRMQYNKNGSGAYSVDVPYAVANYFGYDNARYISSNECGSYEDWIDTVYTELEKNGPVYFSGISQFAGGHAFVCDGYDGDENFHFNWGWDGEGNGYFALTALNVGVYDFNLWQNIVSMPKGKKSDYDNRPIKLTSDLLHTTDSLTYKRKSIDEDFTDIKIKDSRATSFSRNCNVDYSLALFQDGKIISVLPKRTLEYTGSQCIYRDSVTVNLGKGLEGKYELRQVSKESGSSEWLADYGSDDSHFDIDITGNNMAIKKYVKGSEIEVKSVECIGDDFYGIYAYDLVNHGYDFDGTLYTRIFYDKNSSPVYSFFHTKLRKGEHKRVNVRSNYDIALGDSIAVTLGREDDSYVIYEGITDTTQVKIKADVVQLNAKDGKSFGGYIGIKAKITNIDTSAYNRYVKCFIKNINTGLFEASVAHLMNLKPGESKEQTFDFIIDTDFNNVSGQTYRIQLVGYGYQHRRSGVLSEITELYTSEFFNVVPGVVFYSDDMEVVSGVEATSHITVPEEANAVDMRYTTGLVADVTRNSNPNTMYYLDAAYKEPSGLDAANVIKSGYAQSINLKDGYGFCVPVDFRASEVSFTRNFSSNKWNTFVAPFDIEGSDVERLYAKEFIAEVGDNMYFGDAQQMSANLPYLVFDCIGNKTFKAQNVNFISMDSKSANGRDYRFVSTYSPIDSEENIYQLDGDGPEFSKTGKSNAFRAYFIASDGNLAPAEKLNVVLEGTLPPSSAEEVEANTASDKTMVARYSIDGIKLTYDAKGFVIERYADGTVSKRFAR